MAVVEEAGVTVHTPDVCTEQFVAHRPLDLAVGIAVELPGGIRADPLRHRRCRADAGHYPAADQRGKLEGHVIRDLYHAFLRHHHLFGERAATGHAERRGPAVQEPRLDIGGDDVRHAQVRLAAQARRAVAARWQPVRDDMVADGQAGDAIAHGDHLACGLVPEDGRHRLGQAAGAGRQVRVAHPGRADPDPDLARPRADGHHVLADFHPLGVDRMEYGGAHDLPPVSGTAR
jgi:hypothetical protein